MSSSAIFSEFQSGSLNLKNRVVMAPMTRMLSPNNVPDDTVVEYYRLRAAGGTGLIITEGTCIGHPASNNSATVPFIAGDDALAGWKKVVDAVHAEGGKIAPQLWHVGAFRRPGDAPSGDLPGHSPSGMLIPGKVVGHEMTETDIEETIQAYVDAAVNSQKLAPMPLSFTVHTVI